MNFLKRHRKALFAVTFAVLLVGFLAFRPDKLFVDDRVDETLDQAFAGSETVDAPAAANSATSTLPTTAASTPEPPETTTPPQDGAEEPPVETTTVAPPTTSPAPILVGTGDWFGIGHRATGNASVYAQGDRHVLRFEDDTDIQNGPDLYVWLLAADSYDGGSPPDHLDLGKIKGNVGGQNYALPPEYDPDVHRFVLIWCLRFTEPFAGVELR